MPGATNANWEAAARGHEPHSSVPTNRERSITPPSRPGVRASLWIRYMPRKKTSRKRRIWPALAESDDQILTFREFCILNRLSERSGRRLIANGKGPRVIQLSERRIGIRIGDNRRWQESRVR